MVDTTTSLILSTYNWPEALYLCLQSIKEQSILPNQVIIADDGSTQATKNLIENIKSSFPVPIVHVWHEDSGFRLAQIRNKAFALAEFDYLIQIDGDVILHKHFIKDHLLASKTNYLLQGSRVMLGDNYSKKIINSKTATINLFSKGNKRIENGIRIPLISNYLLNRYKNSFPLYYARGANMSFWKKDIYEVNGYNETYEGWGHEDSDLTLRLLNKGVKKAVIKFAAIVYHLYHPERHDSEQEIHNKKLLNKTLEDKIIWTKTGLNQYV